MEEQNSGVIQSAPPVDAGVQTPIVQPVVEGQVASPGQVSEQPRIDPVAEANKAAEGQLQALLAEKERRKQAERQVDYYRNLAEAQGQRQGPQSPSYDPDDLASFSSVEQIVNSKVADIQKSMRQQQIDAYESQAKSKYSDFEQVIALAVDISHEPGMEGLGQAIMSAPNPAEFAYRIGKTHPQYSSIVTQKATATIADKISQNMNSAPTLTSAGGGSVFDNGSDKWKTASKEDIERKIHEIKFGRV